jgi:hypothetical protein
MLQKRITMAVVSAFALAGGAWAMAADSGSSGDTSNTNQSVTSGQGPSAQSSSSQGATGRLTDASSGRSAAAQDRRTHASEQWNWQAGAPSQWVREDDQGRRGGAQTREWDRQGQRDLSERSAMAKDRAMRDEGYRGQRQDYAQRHYYRDDPRRWDAMGEFDSRSDDRMGSRMQRGPRFWRDIDEGSGYTYRDRYYQPDAERQGYYDGPRRQYQAQRRGDQARSAGRSGDRMSQRGTPDYYLYYYGDGRGAHPDYYLFYYPEDARSAARQRDMQARDFYERQREARYRDEVRRRQEAQARAGRSRDHHADYGRGAAMAERERWDRYEYGDRPGRRATGPQGWRGDLGDTLASDQQWSLYDERGVVGPQGWQPGMNERSQRQRMQGQ